MRALSADAALLARLQAAALRGRVHSVFERAVNIEEGGGELVAVASRQLDNAPQTIVVDLADFAAHELRAGDEVVARDGALLVGAHMAFRLEGARPWDPAPLRYPQDDAGLRQNLALLPAVHGGAAPLEARAARALGRGAAALREALARGDAARALAEGRAMLGLGPGLTPAGDDLLVGVLAVLHVRGSPCEPLRGIGAALVGEAAARTHAISLAALRAAARGRVRESVHELLRALLEAAPPAVAAALPRVLAIGSSSGPALAAGIACALGANLMRSRGAVEA